MNRIVRVGSRESVLAVRQAEIVINAVKRLNPKIDFELVTFKTKGDEIQDKTLEQIGGKGLFIKELERALLRREIDAAVHSYKDMPYEETDGLRIVALSEREAPFDALVLPEGRGAPDETKPVGTSSLRRFIQFRELYKGCETAPIRGNVITRLKKLDEGEYSAVILAQAGLIRLGLEHRISRVFTPEEMIPSASQGILAVQGRAGEDYAYLAGFHCERSEYVSRAERQFLKTLGGGCSTPAAVYCEVRGGGLRVSGMYAGEGGGMEKASVCGAIYEAEGLGERLAVNLREKAVGKW